MTALQNVSFWALEPFTALAGQLQSLSLRGWRTAHFSADVIDVVNSSMRCDRCTSFPRHTADADATADAARWLADLCTPPHELQRLEELDLSALTLDLRTHAACCTPRADATGTADEAQLSSLELREGFWSHLCPLRLCNTWRAAIFRPSFISALCCLRFLTVMNAPAAGRLDSVLSALRP